MKGIGKERIKEKRTQVIGKRKVGYVLWGFLDCHWLLTYVSTVQLFVRKFYSLVFMTSELLPASDIKA